MVRLQVFKSLTGETMAPTQSSDNEGGSKKCQCQCHNALRKYPFGMNHKLSSLDTAILRWMEASERESCGLKTAMKDVDDPRNIDIDRPLNDTITDDELLRLTDRAGGYLNSLRLVECKNITATGLKRVFLSNPWLSEVSAVLKGETITVNRNGCGGWFKYRESQKEIITASRTPFNDPSSTSSADDFPTETDPFGMDWREARRVCCVCFGLDL